MIRFIIIALFALTFTCIGYIWGHYDSEIKCQATGNAKADEVWRWWHDRVHSESEFYQHDRIFKCKLVKKFKQAW